MTAVNAAFRDYATRVSFSISLSRNQLRVLQLLVLQIEGGWDARHAAERQMRAQALDGGERYISNDVVAVRWLLGNGIVAEPEEHRRERLKSEAAAARGKNYPFPYHLPQYELTEAGAHLVGLLRCAGLLVSGAANINAAERRRSKA